MAFDMVKRNGRSGAFNAREVKRAFAEEGVFCRRTVRAKVKGKVIPRSFQKI